MHYARQQRVRASDIAVVLGLGGGVMLGQRQACVSANVGECVSSGCSWMKCWAWCLVFLLQRNVRRVSQMSVSVSAVVHFLGLGVSCSCCRGVYGYCLDMQQKHAAKGCYVIAYVSDRQAACF
jgi:hypothetical protein